MQCRAVRPTSSASTRGAAVVEQHEVELLRPVAGGDAGPHRGVRVHPLAGRGARAAAAGRPRGRARSGTTFSMPMTVMRVSGGSGTSARCPRTRPRPACRSRRRRSWRPDTATRARRNLRRRWARAAIGQHGAARRSGPGSTSGISRGKMSRISARLRWIAGTRMCDGLVVAELDDELGEVGLVGGDAGRLERLVEADLLGRHRLDLDHLVGAGRAHEVGRRSGWPRRRRGPSARCRRAR